MSTLRRRIPNQVPVAIRQLLKQRGFLKDQRVGILLHGDKIVSAPNLNIGSLDGELKGKFDEHRIVLLSRNRQAEENWRVSITKHHLMDKNGDWVDGFFTDLLGECQNN